MIKWIKKVFGIAELIDERKKTCLLYTSDAADEL